MPVLLSHSRHVYSCVPARTHTSMRVLLRHNRHRTGRSARPRATDGRYCSVHCLTPSCLAPCSMGRTEERLLFFLRAHSPRGRNLDESPAPYPVRCSGCGSQQTRRHLCLDCQYLQFFLYRQRDSCRQGVALWQHRPEPLLMALVDGFLRHGS